jgi:DNA topoisomerase-1
MKNKKYSLIIVESPSKADKIQDFLGDSYIVKASKGHIADLAKGGKWGIGIDINNNFKPKYVMMEDKYELLNELLDLAKDAEIVYLGTDNDREGEGIAWHIQDRLSGIKAPIKRIVFNEIKKAALLK